MLNTGHYPSCTCTGQLFNPNKVTRCMTRWDDTGQALLHEQTSSWNTIFCSQITRGCKLKLKMVTFSPITIWVEMWFWGLDWLHSQLSGWLTVMAMTLNDNSHKHEHKQRMLHDQERCHVCLMHTSLKVLNCSNVASKCDYLTALCCSSLQTK